MSIAVLLVEDDNFTRSTLAAALERHGIDVPHALSSAREAMALDHLPDVAPDGGWAFPTCAAP